MYEIRLHIKFDSTLYWLTKSGMCYMTSKAIDFYTCHVPLIYQVVKSLTDSWNMEHYQEHGSLYTRLGGYAHNVNQQNMANLMEAIRNLPDRIRGWLDGSSSVNMLITGMTGVGKSSLLNGIVGKDIALVGKSLDRGTLLMQAFSFKYHDVDFTIWDSPGLQDGFGPEKEYIADMQRNGCANTDLILYCIKMNSYRFSMADHDAIRKLTKGLGNDIWKHAVFVMTFANDLYTKPLRDQKLTPEEEQKRIRKLFTERLEEWKTVLVGAVVEAGVDAKVAESIPIVPAGYYHEQALPDRDNWLSPLWYAIILRMKERSQPALLKANLDRIKLPEQIGPEDFHKPLHEQPIVYMPAPVKYGAPPLVFTVLRALLKLVSTGALAGAAFSGATDGLMAYYTSGAHEEQESETASQKVE